MDKEGSGSVTSEDFNDTYKLCEKIATKQLQAFALANSFADQLMNDKVNTYIYNLLKTRSNALDQIRKDIFQDSASLDRDRFCELLGMKAALTNPWSLRVYMETIYKTTPIEKKKINTAGAFGNLFASINAGGPTAAVAKPGEVQLVEKAASK
jgi:hypothetical protein